MPRAVHSSIAKISKLTGFSPMTVSRALRGLGSVRVDTRATILETAKRLGHGSYEGVVFRPSKRNHDSDHRLNICTLGLPLSNEPAMAELATRYQEGLERRLSDYGGSSHNLDVTSLEELLGELAKHRAHALVLRCNVPDAWVEVVRERMPVISAVSLDFTTGVDCIFMNEARAATLALRHLRDHGHAQVVWFGLLDYNVREATISPEKATAVVFNNVHAVRYSHWDLLVNYLPGPKTSTLLLLERDHERRTLSEVLEEGLDRILTMQPKPTAVVVASDIMGRLLADLLLARGIGVPEELSVISYGATRLATEGSPSLASVRVPLDEVGRTIPEIVERRLARPDAPPISILLEPTFVPGASLAGAARSQGASSQGK